MSAIPGPRKLLPADRQSWPFLALLAGFAAAAGSTAMAASHARDHALLSATALVTLPGYGLARFNLAILPQAARTFVPLLAGLAMATLLVAAVQAWRAREWNRTLTWAALGQLAVMLLGLAVIDPGALAGSLIHPVAVALAILDLVRDAVADDGEAALRGIARLHGLRRHHALDQP